MYLLIRNPFLVMNVEAWVSKPVKILILKLNAETLNQTDQLIKTYSCEHERKFL